MRKGVSCLNHEKANMLDNTSVDVEMEVNLSSSSSSMSTVMNRSDERPNNAVCHKNKHVNTSGTQSMSFAERYEQMCLTVARNVRVRHKHEHSMMNEQGCASRNPTMYRNDHETVRTGAENDRRGESETRDHKCLDAAAMARRYSLSNVNLSDNSESRGGTRIVFGDWRKRK